MKALIHLHHENGDMKLQSVVPYVNEMDNIVVIKSMSKDFGIADLDVDMQSWPSTEFQR